MFASSSLFALSLSLWSKKKKKILADGRFICLPVMKLVSVVVSRYDVQEKNVFGLCVQTGNSKFHLRKHLPRPPRSTFTYPLDLSLFCFDSLLVEAVDFVIYNLHYPAANEPQHNTISYRAKTHIFVPSIYLRVSILMQTEAQIHLFSCITRATWH